MIKALLVFILAGTAFLSATATKKIVCYKGTWSHYRNGNGQFRVSQVNPYLCTHLIYAFVGINESGSVILLDSWLDVDLRNLYNFNALKTINPELKTLLAVGGWNEGSPKYSNMASTAASRAVFIQSMLDYVLLYGFDGADLDWEYPNQRGGRAEDVENFVTLIKEMRVVFDQHGLLLTAAVSAAGTSVDLSYDVPNVSKYLDFINVMAYDLHGAWESVTGHNAPLYASSLDTTEKELELNVDACIQGWIDRGADPEKLVLGLALYGRTFTLASSSNSALGAPASGGGLAGPYTATSGFLGYNEIAEKQIVGGWNIVWDDEQQVPHMYQGNQWVSYDDAQSLTLKVNYAINRGLGGVMVWSIETEDFLGLTGTKYNLLKAINVALGRSLAEESTNTTSSSVTSESDSNGNSGSASDGVCTQTGFVRDETNCGIFYMCLNIGDSLASNTYTCSDGLYFDTTTLSCNWPSAVTDCNSS